MRNRLSVEIFIAGLITTVSILCFAQPVSADSIASHDQLGLLSVTDMRQLENLNSQFHADGINYHIAIYSYRSLPENSSWNELDDAYVGQQSLEYYTDIANEAKQEIFLNKLGIKNYDYSSDSQSKKLDQVMRRYLIIFVVPIQRNQYLIIPSGGGIDDIFITDFQNWYSTLGLHPTTITGANVVHYAQRYATFYRTHYAHDSQYPRGQTPDWNMIQSFIVVTSLLWFPIMFLLWSRRQPPQGPYAPDDYDGSDSDDDFFMGYIIGSEMKDHNNG